MDIWIFSDESGTFDYVHHDWCIYGGMIIPDKQELDLLSRKYIALERKLRRKTKYRNLSELKATILDERDRKLFYAIFRDTLKFAAVIREKKLDIGIYKNPKTKQRYLDFAYRRTLRKAFEGMMLKRKIVQPSDILHLHVNEDEHRISTGTDLRRDESIFREFTDGVYRSDSNQFCPPVFGNLQKVSVQLHDSKKNTLIRGADIIANTVYVSLIRNELNILLDDPLFHIEFLP